MHRVDVPAEPAKNHSPLDSVAGSVKDPSPAGVASATNTNTIQRRRDSWGKTSLWLHRGDQILLGCLLIALLVLLIAFRWKLSGGWRTPIEISSQQPREYFYSIDINNASWVEWAQLDGIGEKLARRIVKDREDRGAFKSIDDVRRVRGLGPKLIEKLRPFLSCNLEPTRQPKPQDIKEPR